MSELGPTLTSSDRTATDELRRLLDERGVEWKGQEDIHTDFTFWCGVHACETGPKPSLAVYNLTPEQAIAATLEADELGAENAKLRELLSEIAKLVTNPYGGCLRPGCAHGCPHHLECDEELHTCFYVDRIRELGVEVE